jgi:hypothetical protein
MPGKAAYNITIRACAPPAVALTDEAMETTDNITWTLVDESKQYLTLNDPVVVEISLNAGVDWDPITTGFTLRRVGAAVIFDEEQDPVPLVRLASAQYLPVLEIGEAHSAEYMSKLNTAETTTFASNGDEEHTATTRTGTMKCSYYSLESHYVDLLEDRDQLIISYEEEPGGERLEGYCYVTDSNIKSEAVSVVQGDLTFQLTNRFYFN